jgi:hypothetical protein
MSRVRAALEEPSGLRLLPDELLLPILAQLPLKAFLSLRAVEQWLLHVCAREDVLLMRHRPHGVDSTSWTYAGHFGPMAIPSIHGPVEPRTVEEISARCRVFGLGWKTLSFRGVLPYQHVQMCVRSARNLTTLKTDYVYVEHRMNGNSRDEMKAAPLSTSELVELCGYLPNLTELDASLTDRDAFLAWGAAAIARCCPLIESFDPGIHCKRRGGWQDHFPKIEALLAPMIDNELGGRIVEPHSIDVDATVETLRACPRMRTLQIKEVSRIDPGQITRIIGACSTRLTTLVLKDVNLCSQDILDEFLAAVGSCSVLETLVWFEDPAYDEYYDGHVGDWCDLEYLAKFGAALPPTLTHLQLPSGLKDDEIRAVLMTLKTQRLFQLDLSGPPNLFATDEDEYGGRTHRSSDLLECIADAPLHSSIQFLELSRNDFLEYRERADGDHAEWDYFERLAKKCPMLKHIEWDRHEALVVETEEELFADDVEDGAILKEEWDRLVENVEAALKPLGVTLVADLG